MDTPRSLAAGHPMLERLARDLAARPGERAPEQARQIRAAVAMLFAVQGGTTEFLFIERAVREGDPWSGHVALPGGRWDAADRSLRDTVIRETREETGIDLATAGELFGTLDDLRPVSPSLPPVVVTPFVGVVRAGLALTPSDEVAEAFWVPWARLGEAGVRRESTVRIRGASVAVPSYVLGRHTVWGMTERLLEQLFARIREAGHG